MDTKKINELVPKSDAATAEKTTKYSQGTSQYSKEKWKSAKSKQREHTQYTGHTKTPHTKPKSRIILLPRLHENKKVNTNLVKTNQRLYRPTATDTILTNYKRRKSEKTKQIKDQQM